MITIPRFPGSIFLHFRIMIWRGPKWTKTLKWKKCPKLEPCCPFEIDQKPLVIGSRPLASFITHFTRTILEIYKPSRRNGFIKPWTLFSAQITKHICPLQNLKIWYQNWFYFWTTKRVKPWSKLRCLFTLGFFFKNNLWSQHLVLLACRYTVRISSQKNVTVYYVKLTSSVQMLLCFVKIK
jgi:hypothetical protein